MEKTCYQIRWDLEVKMAGVQALIYQLYREMQVQGCDIKGIGESLSKAYKKRRRIQNQINKLPNEAWDDWRA